MKCINIFGVFVLACLFSCTSTRKLDHHCFRFQSYNRSLDLIFENRSTCKLENIFYCDDLDRNVRKISIVCDYRRVHDTLFLKNVNCKNFDCQYPPFVDIPYQNSKNCAFLNQDARFDKNINSLYDGDHTPEFSKYGVIPNIDIDTAYIFKNKIVLCKMNEGYYRCFVFTKYKKALSGDND